MMSTEGKNVDEEMLVCLAFFSFRDMFFFFFFFFKDTLLACSFGPSRVHSSLLQINPRDESMKSFGLTGISLDRIGQCHPASSALHRTLHFSHQPKQTQPNRQMHQS